MEAKGSPEKQYGFGFRFTGPGAFFSFFSFLGTTGHVRVEPKWGDIAGRIGLMFYE